MALAKIKEQQIWGGIFKCLAERPMTMSEMTEKILNSTSACSVGRIAVRTEAMIQGGLVVPIVAKGLLFFRLNEIKEKKVA